MWRRIQQAGETSLIQNENPTRKNAEWGTLAEKAKTPKMDERHPHWLEILRVSSVRM
jgi:hypothetical protein